jgi:hypothetical protein
MVENPDRPSQSTFLRQENPTAAMNTSLHERYRGNTLHRYSLFKGVRAALKIGFHAKQTLVQGAANARFPPKTP